MTDQFGPTGVWAAVPESTSSEAWTNASPSGPSTRNRFGRLASNKRFTRFAGRVSPFAATVVFDLRTPRSLLSPISRATLHRPAVKPSCLSHATPYAPVNPEVPFPHRSDLRPWFRVTSCSQLQRSTPGRSRLALVVVQKGDCQLFADRPHPYASRLGINERNTLTSVGGGSQHGRKGEALRNRSFARRASPFSRSRAFSRSPSSLFNPAPPPPSHSVGRPHLPNGLCRALPSDPGAVHPAFPTPRLRMTSPSSFMARP